MPNEPVEILLVEDNPADVELALHALRHQKIANRIEVARDGEEALTFLFNSGAPHTALRLVLLDLKLPKVDGLQVLRAMKDDLRTRHIPVVILTSSRQEQDLVRSYQLGVNSYIQKPVDFDQFTEIVRQLGLYWLLINEPAPAIAGGASHA
jgi:CheY-like chemotaxis protein